MYLDLFNELRDFSLVKGLIILVPLCILIYLERQDIFFFLLETTQKVLGDKRDLFFLTRHVSNPLLSPRSYLGWEKEGVFNPAALLINNTVHLLYRAIGSDGVSRVGYAQSEDGEHFSEGLEYPIFSFKQSKPLGLKEKKYDPVMYPSGGSWGGAEDPRATCLDGKVYMTFNAFDGWDFIRVALTVIDEQDLVDGKWKWMAPRLISPPGQIHKNWVIFPEKINGKYAILHSISPNVEVEYRDNLETIGTYDDYIKSPVGVRTSGRKDAWDTRVRGAGPPPVKTNDGWLVFYHANDATESHKYKLGVKLLDLHDPSKILARSKSPILEPDMWYENDWKPGIVYACGAIIKDDTLHIYYGGGDKHVCSARTKVDELLSWLKKEEERPLQLNK
jgi:predicted GH43/DUF377 family glycosyl hydrolase